MEMKDWATTLIEEMMAVEIANIDEATTAFCEAYHAGDSVKALEQFESKAERIFDSYDFAMQTGNHYYLYLFRDGSVYAEWKQGIDRFYPSIGDLADEDEDVAELVKHL